jgi:hypothetical protein
MRGSPLLGELHVLCGWLDQAENVTDFSLREHQCAASLILASRFVPPRPPRESGDPCCLGPRIRGDDEVLGTWPDPANMADPAAQAAKAHRLRSPGDDRRGLSACVDRAGEGRHVTVAFVSNVA